jgi:four helix bundle protein
MMTKPIFDHDRLDVYRLSIDYVASSFKIVGAFNGLHRHARDQWLRGAQSIPLNIAEGNGKRSLKDRNHFLGIARGSALECAAIQDVLAATDGIDDSLHRDLKLMLKRVVAMLTRLIARSDVVSKSSTEYNAADEYEYRDAEYEYRDAEYEYEHEEDQEPEPRNAPKDAASFFSRSMSPARPR